MNLVLDGNSMLLDYPGKPNYTVIWALRSARVKKYHNLAKIGINTAELVKRAPEVIDPLFIPKQKNVLFIWELSNDLSYRNKNREEVYDNIKKYCEDRKKIGWIVILATCLPRAHKNDYHMFEEHRITVNQLIRDNAIPEGWADVVCDFALIKELSDCNNKEYYASDTIHLTVKGHQLAKEVMKKSILSTK